MVLKINSKKAVLSSTLLKIIIVLVVLAIIIPTYISYTKNSKSTIEGVFNCKNPLGWNGKCIHVSKSCEEFGLKDWSKLPYYENACYDKSKPETKELKCCMYTKDPKEEMYIVVEEKPNSGEATKYILKKDKKIYTGSEDKDVVDVKLVIYNIKNDYLPQECKKIKLTVQLPNEDLAEPCMDNENATKTYECNVNPDEKTNIGNCILPFSLVESDYFNLKEGGCYLTLLGYSEDNEIIFTDEFWIDVVKENYEDLLNK